MSLPAGWISTGEGEWQRSDGSHYVTHFPHREPARQFEAWRKGTVFIGEFLNRDVAINACERDRADQAKAQRGTPRTPAHQELVDRFGSGSARKK